tara:strand:- start:200 stop:343 length:144 start_codon:yes stop_codon:yes gene_type:complete
MPLEICQIVTGRISQVGWAGVEAFGALIKTILKVPGLRAGEAAPGRV